jgi:hypothetical protein
VFHPDLRVSKFFGALGASAGIALAAVYVTNSAAQSPKEDASNASPIYGVTIPPGYRDWKLIAVNHLDTDKIHQLRAQLGNDIAIKAVKEGTLPFPDGSIIAALHWNQVSSKESDDIVGAIFPGAHSGFAGPPANVQFMVKDSKRYAATGGWGFGDFKDGKPNTAAIHQACFGCHVPAKDRDYVFAHYASAP